MGLVCVSCTKSQIVPLVGLQAADVVAMMDDHMTPDPLTTEEAEVIGELHEKRAVALARVSGMNEALGEPVFELSLKSPVRSPGAPCESPFGAGRVPARPAGNGGCPVRFLPAGCPAREGGRPVSPSGDGLAAGDNPAATETTAKVTRDHEQARAGHDTPGSFTAQHPGNAP